MSGHGSTGVLSRVGLGWTFFLGLDIDELLLV